ncbi:hypothetical protein [Actinomycetospora soli]|uniref:hypothetical protein n=1 Tax=Actinomycetospora soli TaxID=2893887 RepID=UPI001E52BE47|nr:hypothetical protein [Actinomycetospora soli]MCD2187830.1 hypothetical protein [Actinomycetospora soli]
MDHDVVLRRLRGKNAGDGLGFGLPELLPLLSPALFIALDQALRKVVDLSVEGGVKGLARRFRRGRGSSPSSPAIPALSDEQVSDVVARVRESLERDGVPEGQARDVATALARALPRSPRPEDGGRREVDHVVDD